MKEKWVEINENKNYRLEIQIGENVYQWFLNKSTFGDGWELEGDLVPNGLEFIDNANWYDTNEFLESVLNYIEFLAKEKIREINVLLAHFLINRK